MAEVKAAPNPVRASKPVAKTIQAKKSEQAQTDLLQPRRKSTDPRLSQASFTGNDSQVDRSIHLNRSLWDTSVQTKLKVGKPNDPYEQEADAMADKVVQARFNGTPAISTKAEEELDQKPEKQSSEEPEELQTQVEENKLQTKPEEVQTKEEEEPELQLQPEEEPEVQAKMEEDPEIQAKQEDEPDLQAMVDEEPEIQEKAEEELQGKDAKNQVSDSFESQLNSSNGGSPLSASTLSRVEPHLNADFSSVRVHTDSQSVQMNQQLGSQAFAHKKDIYFNEGKYNPGTSSGDHLIAHELTHTVQQGAVVQTKLEEQPEEEIQTSPEANPKQKEGTAAPVDDGDAPSAKPAANDSNSNNAPADSTPPTDQSGSGTPPGTNKPPADLPPATPKDHNLSTAEPQADLNKDNPITQRAANYKEEEIKTVEELGLEGNSEQAMDTFTSASASQVAISLPGLGDKITQKLGSEKQVAAKEAPVLTAGTSGVKDQKEKPTSDPGKGKDANVKDGITEAEPAPQKIAPHHEGAPRQRHRVDKEVDKGKPEKAESGGFFSWLFDKFKDVMGGIKTSDKGLNTNAGLSPRLDTKGKANPERAKNVSNEGKEQVNQEKELTTQEINKNPGQENIQPLYFEEPNPVKPDTEVQTQILTEQDKVMGDFVNMPLPESVRAQADLDMAPAMQKSMAQPKQKTQQAATKRNADKKAAIDQSQAEVEKLNQEAEKQQQHAVAKNRAVVAAEQKRGIEEAKTQTNAFTTEADKEQVKANKEVNARITKDQGEANKKLKQAEADAAKEKKKGEAKARAEKEAAKRNSKKKSWWGKFKDAVSSAVSWVTEKIGKIFDAVRKAVKVLIDKAKKAALALIEAGRKWVVDKLDKFGKWLKDKANKYLKHFPALRKRVNAFIDKTVNAAKAVVNKIADGLKKGVEALANKLTNAINAVLNAFETALTAAVQVAGALLKGDFKEALKIAFFATCKVAGIDPNPILNFINKAGETISKIFKDPAQFFTNVASGVKMGLDQFVTNIKKHLISGLIGWLTGAMSDVPIQMPEKFDLKGIFSLVMQILGLTYDRIRAKLVKKLGPKGEQIVSTMEKTFQFVKDLVTKGPMALWEKIKEKFTEIKEMAMEKIRNLVTIEVVKAGIKWVIGLLNPASAIVKAVLMLYDFVMFLIERKDQIIGFVTAVFDTVGPLARGQVKKAANAVEGAMGRGVPVILGLLANLAGLGGIGKSVSTVIKTIQKPVDKVVNPIIGWLVKQGKKLWAKGGSALKSVAGKGEKGAAIAAMQVAGSNLQKVPKNADKAEEQAQSDLTTELRKANKGLSRKAGKVSGTIRNKGRIVPDSRAEFQLKAGATSKTFVRKYATNSEAARHKEIVKKALKEIDQLDAGKSFTEILKNKKEKARKLEKEKTKQLNKGIALSLSIKNEKTAKKDEFLHWKAVIKPNATEADNKDEVETGIPTIVINDSEPGVLLSEPTFKGESGTHATKSPNTPKIAYVANVPTLFSENAIGNIYNRYKKDGFEDIEDAKQRFGLVIGQNDSQSLDTAEFTAQTSAMQTRGASFSSDSFPVRVHSFFWQPFWKKVDSKNTKSEVKGETKLSYQQAKPLYDQLDRDKSQGPEELAAYNIAKAENQRRGRRNNIPFGRVRDEIKNSPSTRELLALFTPPQFDNAYIHWGDADAKSLRSKTAGAGSTDEQTRVLFQQDSQVIGQALFNRYDTIINSYADNEKPLLIFGGVEFRLKLRNNEIDPAQYARVLAQELDMQVRKALVARHPEAVYPNDQNLLIHATGNKTAFDIASGSGRNEALNLKKGLVSKARQRRTLKRHGDLTSRIVYNYDAIIATDDKAYPVDVRSSNPNQSIIDTNQPAASTRWFQGAFRGMTVYDIKQLFLQRQTHAKFSDPRNWADIFGNNLGLVYRDTFKDLIRVAQWIYPPPGEMPLDIRGLFDVAAPRKNEDVPAIDEAFIGKINNLSDLAKPVSFELILNDIATHYGITNLDDISGNLDQYKFNSENTQPHGAKVIAWFFKRKAEVEKLIEVGKDQRRSVISLMKTGVNAPPSE